MRIKTTLKKLKRGDVVSIDWNDVVVDRVAIEQDLKRC